MSQHLDFDVIVIGGGTIGLSAAYYAASAGQKVLLVEQFDLENNLNSSSGYSRFFRMMYSEKNMAQLSEVSYALWKQLETLTKTTLVEETPLLFYGAKDAGETVEGDFNNTDKVMSSLGIPYSAFNREELLSKYSVFKDLPQNYTGLLQENSGVIKANVVLKTLHKLALEKGVKVLSKTSAQILTSGSGKHHLVKVGNNTLKCGGLILAPGAWTNDVIAPLGVKFAFKIWQMTVAYFALENPSIKHPFWYEFGPKAGKHPQLFYGFPQAEYPNKIKVSADFTNHIYDHVSECSRNPDPEIIRMLENFMKTRFKNVIPKAEENCTCLYTMSSDYHMILGLLPGYTNVAILTGESGRAFKYTPLFGRILAELVREGGTHYNLEGLSINRAGLLC